MSEIKTPPILEHRESGEPYYTFGPEHSIMDIFRFVLEQLGGDMDNFKADAEAFMAHPEGHRTGRVH